MTKKSSFKSQPEPYQIPLIYPPFPAIIPRHKQDNDTKVSNMLRNYVGVQKKELSRLRNDLTAYRQEAQTAFRTRVAFPHNTVNYGQASDPSEDFTEEVNSDITDASVYNPPAPPDAPTVVLSLQNEPIPTIAKPLKTEFELMSVNGFGAEPPPAPIPLIPPPPLSMPSPLSAPQPLPAPEPIPSVKIPAMVLEREPRTREIDFQQQFERPAPAGRGGRGGKRKGAGRPKEGFKSKTELRRLLKDEYGIVGTSILTTDQLRSRAIEASKNQNIVFKDF